MTTPQFSEHAAAVEALREGAGGSTAHRLVILAFVDQWAPPAYATAVGLESIRAQVQAYASIFIVDATAERDAAHDAGVLATPALLFFWEGQQAIVSRPAWDDDDKYSGAVPADRLVEIIRHARDCFVKQAREGGRLVVAVE